MEPDSGWRRRWVTRCTRRIPALTPLTANAPAHAALSGISLTVTLSARTDGKRRSATGGFLFTHKGYSGPSVLDLSHLAVRARLAGGARQEITVQWTELDAAAWEARLRAGGTVHVGTLVRRELPDRLAEMLLESASVSGSTPASQLKREERIRLVAALANMPLPWTGDEGYKKAEVTGGGVALSEVDPRTMESRRIARIVHVRGDAGRVRADRGIQLPVGLGDGESCGAGSR